MAVGARNGAAIAKHEVSTVRWLASRFDERRAVPVEVSANDQDYSADGVTFAYTPPLAFDEISPSTGAIGGGTPVSLFGTALRGGSNYSISFGETIVPATYRYAGGYRAGADVLLVRSPPQGAAGVQTVRVTTNGQQYVDAPPFGYYDAPVVSAVSPTTGPRDGGTLLTLHGSNFEGGSRYLCRWAHDVNASLGSAAAVEGRVGTHFSRDYEWEEGTHFGAPTVDATYDSAAPHVLRCVTPAGLDFGALRLEVSLNAQEFSSSSVNYSAYDTPRLHALAELGTHRRRHHVRVRGVALAGGSHYLCRFGDVAVVNATYVSDAATSVRAREPTAFVG